ncbi:NAD(P)-dependent oxidoreductase [Tatumella citrea]|uniref:6-phosphogluconate dehydrogenase n=1 Tax=Tatumella citrea TaxID=53336 RepID=A0A1Y0LJR1_TATCI|nr:DUF1932 domain-containing protein [Tatumella citrea]ARU94296.1 6-phosphogluconate dehydrogenase [Tatumella citrea]ARU98336.1 6-phosphogluconate dehydrogenase [Tatumella citrea]
MNQPQALVVKKITLIGLGEVGTLLAQELQSRWPEIRLSAYDWLYTQPAMQQRAQTLNVTLCENLADALADSQLIFSVVTADSARCVAEQAAAWLGEGQYFLDLNSVSPLTKQKNSRSVTSASAEYIDVAVMAPFPPARLGTPLLTGGPSAELISHWLNEHGFSSSVHSKEIGEASAIKMCRSVMIKGLEALTVECLSAARMYGVEEEVLSSLHRSFPSLGWDKQLGDYLVSRVAEHGKRRAEEMAEVAKTLKDVGVTPSQSLATRETQQRFVDELAALQLSWDQLQPFSWKKVIDRIYRTEASEPTK